ncbi:MAG: carboxyl-terminal processing protease CtpB [Chroococcales cyanobacterium]
MNQFIKNSPLLQGLLFSVATATLTTSTLLAPSFHRSAQAELKDSPKAIVDEVWQLVNREFVDKNFNQSDWQATRRELLSRDYTSYEEAYRAIREALTPLNDPYTRFLEPKEFELLTSQTSGEMSGIGIRLEIDDKTKVLTVVEPIENSPAIAAGIKAGDKILAIDGKPTSLMTIEQASEHIRGETGTEVRLKLSRSGQEPFEVTLTRAQIELPTVRYTLREDNGIQVGYIKLNEFSSHAAEQMERAIEALKQQDADAFVLDLRGNPGGLLYASIDIARMWMEDGDIVRTVDRRGGDRYFKANHTALTNLPLAVLVDENSASASEILAGALKDNKRATIIGTNTFGKGKVQSVHSLSDGSGLAVTISRYYPPSGIDINHRGITPDIQVDLTGEQQVRLSTNPTLFGTPADPQYSRAISVLKTNPISQESPQQLGEALGQNLPNVR